MPAPIRHGDGGGGWRNTEAAAAARASCERLKAERTSVVSRRNSQSVSEPRPTMAAATGGGKRNAIAMLTGLLIVTSTSAVTGAGRRFDAAQAMTQKSTAQGPTLGCHCDHDPAITPYAMSAVAPRM